MANQHYVQSISGFSISYFNIGVLGGLVIDIDTAKLDGQIAITDQIIDNATVVPLINGSAATVINDAAAGTLQINAISGSTDPSTGDLPALCWYIRNNKVSTLGTLIMAATTLGARTGTTFLNVALMRCPDLVVEGNDVSTYPITFTYSRAIKF